MPSAAAIVLRVRLTKLATNAFANGVNLRLKRHQSLALQTVPAGKNEPRLAQVVLLGINFFGR